MLTLNRFLLFIVLTSCLLTYGCNTAKDVGQTLGDLAKVRAELIKKFGDKDVNLRINNFDNQTALSISYINSPLNQKTAAERERRAQETANIVRQHYPLKNINGVWIAFLRTTTRLIILRSSEVLEIYGFDNEARPLRGPDTTPVDPSQPVVRYLESQNKTDISSSGILLEGTPEKGVSFVPHYSVAGDVNKTTPKPPREVSLDFAVFSEKPRFPNVTKIVFLSDNKPVYKTEAQFSSSKMSADMYSEFLYLNVPTAAFLKITSGSSIKIRLNEDEYTLTDSQMLQIQRMSDYLK